MKRFWVIFTNDYVNLTAALTILRHQSEYFCFCSIDRCECLINFEQTHAKPDISFHKTSPMNDKKQKTKNIKKNNKNMQMICVRFFFFYFIFASERSAVLQFRYICFVINWPICIGRLILKLNWRYWTLNLRDTYV